MPPDPPSVLTRTANVYSQITYILCNKSTAGSLMYSSQSSLDKYEMKGVWGLQISKNKETRYGLARVICTLVPTYSLSRFLTF